MDNKAGNSEKLFTMIFFVMNSVHSCSYRNMKRRNNSRLFELTLRNSQYSVKCQLPHALKLLKYNHTTNL